MFTLNQIITDWPASFTIVENHGFHPKAVNYIANGTTIARLEHHLTFNPALPGDSDVKEWMQVVEILSVDELSHRIAYHNYGGYCTSFSDVRHFRGKGKWYEHLVKTKDEDEFPF
jgi:hypothetical protein